MRLTESAPEERPAELAPAAATNKQEPLADASPGPDTEQDEPQQAHRPDHQDEQPQPTTTRRRAIPPPHPTDRRNRRPMKNNRERPADEAVTEPGTKQQAGQCRAEYGRLGAGDAEHTVATISMDTEQR